jgi:hypothetical protein
VPSRRRVELWSGVAVVVIGGAIAAVMATRGSMPAGGSAEAGIATAGAPGAVDSPAAPANDVAPGSAPGGGDRAQAARLLDDGQAQASAGHYAAAHALYQRAYALDPKPSTLFEVGLMEHLSGRCREARRTTQRVVAESQGDPVRAQAQELLAKIGRCD